LRQRAARRPQGRAHLLSFSQRKGASQTVTSEPHEKAKRRRKWCLGQEFGAGGRTTSRLWKRCYVQISATGSPIPTARVRASGVGTGLCSPVNRFVWASRVAALLHSNAQFQRDPERLERKGSMA
jgi:hypothetical protein